MIKCTLCGIKTEDHHPHTLKCRTCYNLIRRTEKIRERDRKRNQDPKRQEADRRRSLKRRHDPKNREKMRVLWQTNNLIKKGELVRATHCEECGKKCKTWANQKGNTDPRDIRWLCYICNNPHNIKRKHTKELTRENLKKTILNI